MEMIKVYVVYNFADYNKEDVVKEIQEEGYKHNFVFGANVPIEDKEKYIKLCNEVWIWGDCNTYPDVKIAENVGADRWQMS